MVLVGSTVIGSKNEKAKDNDKQDKSDIHKAQLSVASGKKVIKILDDKIKEIESYEKSMEKQIEAYDKQLKAEVAIHHKKLEHNLKRNSNKAVLILHFFERSDRREVR